MFDTVFPLVFSISGAYKQRAVALDEYGSMFVAVIVGILIAYLFFH